MANPEVFDWYIKNYGYTINLFVGHSQIVQLECLRQGVWGQKQRREECEGYPSNIN